jgi:tetratricopeptide (TPR) repeat protein
LPLARGLLLAIALIATSGAWAQAWGADPLAEARDALATGNVAAATAAAEQAARDAPDDGEARLVLGMTRFRAGRYEEALQAFDEAASAARPAPTATIEFNRGATLFKMGRFADAERAFTAAASADGRLATVALLDAGLAALEGGDADRAEADLQRAAAAPRADEIAGALGDLRREIAAARDVNARDQSRRARADARRALLAGRADEAIARYRSVLRDAEARRRPAAERAELLYALGNVELGAGRTAEARDSFEDAATLAPHEGEFLYMAAESAMRLDQRAMARRRFAEALAAGLDAESARNARAALDRLAPGLRALGRGFSLDLIITAGYDSNAAQAGIARTEVLGRAGGSGFAEAALDVAWRFPLGQRLFVALSYGLDQLAYFETGLDQFDLQQHAASATVEARLFHRVRATLMAGGDLLFTGLEDFTPFQRTLTVRPGLAVDEGDRLTTRLEVERDDKHILDAAFLYLEGTRTDVTVSQDIGARHAQLALSYRYRDEELPNPAMLTVTPLPAAVPGVAACGPGSVCSGQYQIPYAYRSHAGVGRLDLSLPRHVLLTLGASVEDRPYSKASVLEIIAPVTAAGAYQKVRHDWRYGAGVALSLGGAVHQISLRYDLIVNRSNLDDAHNPLDYDNKNFAKHVVSLELTSSWLAGGAPR